VTPMQEFRIRLFDEARRLIQVIPAVAETETIAVVRAAHLATETGAADFEVRPGRCRTRQDWRFPGFSAKPGLLVRLVFS
jgi:hypothetical protein